MPPPAGTGAGIDAGAAASSNPTGAAGGPVVPDDGTPPGDPPLTAGLVGAGGPGVGGDGGTGSGAGGGDADPPGGEGSGASVDPGLSPDAAAYGDMERSEAMARISVQGVVSDGGLEVADLSAILGARSLPPALRTLPVMVATTGGATLLFAFMFFNKRRQDGEQPADDEVLAAAAASGAGVVSAATLVPVGEYGSAGSARWRSGSGSAPPGPPIDPEAHLPRWRRPSLMEARKADPIRDHREVAPMTFTAPAAALGAAVTGAERRRIRYRLVSLLDRPDELAGLPIGTLDQGDEVQLLEQSGAYWRVLCPTGQEGWIHRMTLGEAVLAGAADAGQEPWSMGASVEEAAGLLALYADRLGGREDAIGEAVPCVEPAEDDGALDADVLAAFLAARREGWQSLPRDGD